MDWSEISSFDAQRILEPHFHTLGKCLQAGFLGWETIARNCPAEVLAASKRTKTSFISDLIWKSVRDHFPDSPESRCSEARQLRLLYLYDSIAIRFKKLDKAYRSRNIPTLQQQQFVQHMFLPGIENVPRITIGYVQDTLGSQINEMVAVCQRDSNSHYWTLNFGIASNILPIQLDMVSTEFEAEAFRRKRRVVTRKAPESAAEA